jgi:hypothetical protein
MDPLATLKERLGARTTSLGNPLRPSTINKHLNCLYTILRRLDLQDPAGLADTARVDAHLEEKYANPATRLSAAQSVLVACRELGLESRVCDHYTDMVSRLTMVRDSLRDRSLAHAKFKKDPPTLAELQEVARGLRDGSLDKAIWAMYVLRPPRRAEDVSILVWGEDQGQNCMWADPEGRIWMRMDHAKSSQTHGTYKEKLPDEASRAVMAWVGAAQLDEGDPIFTRKKGQVMNPHAFAVWVNNRLTSHLARPGVRLTITDIRHIYATNADRMGGSTAQKREVATAMGHTLEMQRTYTDAVASERDVIRQVMLLLGGLLKQKEQAGDDDTPPGNCDCHHGPAAGGVGGDGAEPRPGVVPGDSGLAPEVQ